MGASKRCLTLAYIFLSLFSTNFGQSYFASKIQEPEIKQTRTDVDIGSNGRLKQNIEFGWSGIVTAMSGELKAIVALMYVII